MGETSAPFRFSILKLLSNNTEGLTPYQIYEMLQDHYPNEKQCQPENIDEHLMSMKGVGLVEQKNAVLDKKNQLVITYTITDCGKEKVKKYIG